ncbi:hypothetical protein cyc_07664 [Cyclospora cayetanensis]|uniref:Uncharacterized protein n=1 Tax=Cyclospora cayetanensis TaxID=88456 RepID=A0A1D3CWK6_9EIME|nr:hypothetical protein cyc_07664 [Cyclospora cayetanensis]
MEPIYKSRLPEGRHPVGSSASSAGLLSVSGHTATKLASSGTSETHATKDTGILYGKSTGAGLNSQQAAPYGTSTGGYSSWSSSVNTSLNPPTLFPQLLSTHQDGSKTGGTGIYHGHSPSLQPMQTGGSCSATLHAGPSRAWGLNPTVSTVASLLSDSQNALPPGDADSGFLSKHSVSHWSGSAGLATHSLTKTAKLNSLAESQGFLTTSTRNGPFSASSNINTRLLPCVPPLTVKRTAHAAPQPEPVRESRPESSEGSSRLRELSSSTLKLSSLGESVDMCRHYPSPALRAPTSTFLTQIRKGVPHVQRSLGSPLASSCLTESASSMNLHRQSEMYLTQLKDSRDGASSSTFALPTTYTPAERLLLLSSKRHHLQPNAALAAPSAACTGAQEAFHSPAADWAADQDDHANMENKQQNFPRFTGSSVEFSGSLPAPGPRTERVRGFVEFLRELYMDQDQIPASSVVECLATLASYAQGLPAPQGSSLPWCCVADREIAPGEKDLICLKDRVVVRLLNTLMRSAVLSTTQLSATNSSSRREAGDPTGGGLGASVGSDPLVVVLSSCPSGWVRVSLQPSSECSESAEGGTPSLIPLAACSSAALLVSAIETLSRHHHMRMSAAPAAKSNSHRSVHLCYSSLLRWLWDEVRARRREALPFDVSTSLIACEACSSSICSDAECAAVLPNPGSLSEWLRNCNFDLALLLLLALASRPVRPALTVQLLEQTSAHLGKCSAVGVAAWLRASAVMGVSSLENPAIFGRVLNAVADLLPEIPLGTVLADVLWAMTLCRIPSRDIFLQAASGIGRNMHMFELDDLCLIACCYALQSKGFGGVSADSRGWSYGGYPLPSEFLRRPTGLKAYCLLGAVKIADTGPTPTLGSTNYTLETTQREASGRRFEENREHKARCPIKGTWTPEELICAIVDTCQGSYTHIGPQYSRVLDFTRKIMGITAGNSATAAPYLQGDRSRGFLGSAAGSSSDGEPSNRAEVFHDPASDRFGSVGTDRLPSDDAGVAAVHPTDEVSRLASSALRASMAGAAAVRASPEIAEKSLQTEFSDNFRAIAGEEQASTRECGAVHQEPGSDTPPSSQEIGPMWGDQYVPAPARLCALHNFGADVHAKGPPGRRKLCGVFASFCHTLAFWEGCVSFTVRAFFGYLFIVFALYVFSLS